MYNLLGNLQYPAFVFMLVLASVKYRAPVKQKIVLWLAFAAARFWGVGMVPVLSRITGGIIPGINMGVGFLFFVLVLAAITYFANTPILFSLDAAIPAFILGRGLAISGCIFEGCCHGYPVSWGIYSAAAETYTFPTVLLDILISCCIVVYLIFLAKKQQYSGNGVTAATGMILFGLLRILVDVLRDNQKLAFMLTAEGFFGFIYVVSGYLLLRHINHSQKPKGCTCSFRKKLQMIVEMRFLSEVRICCLRINGFFRCWR